MQDKELNRLIGARLRRARLAKGLTQEELGAACGVSFQQIQKYERGTNRITVEVLARAADALERPRREFIPEIADQAKAAEDDMAAEAALASPMGVRLVKAFAQITSAEGREAATFLAESIAARDGAVGAPRRRRHS